MPSPTVPTGGDPRPEALLAHLDWARQLARGLVRDEATADDVVQGVFAQALARPPRHAASLRGWLGRALGNEARQRGRAEKRRARRERSAARGEALPSAAELTEKAEAHRVLMVAVLALDEDLRRVVLLRYFEGLSAAEIARRLGAPAGTIRWRLSRGLDELRAELDARFGGERERWHHAFAPLVAAPLATPGAGLLPTSLLGIVWMKWILYSFAAAVALLLVGSLLVVTGLVGSPFGGAPPREVVQYAPLPELAPAGPPGIEAPGSSGGTARVPVAAAPPREDPAGPAPGTAHVRLRFVDEEGSPVPDVAVRSWSSAATVHSTADGRARLELTPPAPDGETQLAHAAPGYANDSLSVRLRPGADLDLGEVVLRAGGALSGRVVDEAGAPLEGVRVAVRGAEVSEAIGGGMRMSHRTALGAADAVTDADGRFRLTGLLAGDVIVEAESADSLHHGESGRVEIRAGQESLGLVVVAARIPDDRRIEGRVLDPSGHPVPRASVRGRYRTLFSGGSIGVQSDRDGHFRMILPSSVSLDLEVSDPQDRWNTIFAEGVPAGTLDAELRFVESRPLQVELAAPGGRRPDRASLSLRAASGDERYLGWYADLAVSAAEPLVIRRPDEPYRLHVLADGFAEAVVGPLSPDTGGPVRVELVRLPGPSGRVTLVGRAAPGADVTAWALATERAYCDGVPVWVQPDPVARTTADADGSFELTVREPGRFFLRAELAGHAPAELGPYDLVPGTPLRGLELSLGLGGSIEGRVTRPDGRRTASVVLASRGDARAQTARTSPDGDYRFDDLLPGPWELRLVDEELSSAGSSQRSEPGRPFRSIDADCVVRVGETTRHDLGAAVARDPVRLSGRFGLAGAAPEGWIAVGLDREGPGEPVECRLDAGGRFALEIHSGGSQVVQLAPPDPGLPRFALELDLPPGDHAWEADVALGTLDLTALDGSAQPLFAVWERPEDGLSALVEVSANGTVNAPVRVPAGRVRIVHPGFAVGQDPRDWDTVGEVEVAPEGITRYEP